MENTIQNINDEEVAIAILALSEFEIEEDVN